MKKLLGQPFSEIYGTVEIPVTLSGVSAIYCNKITKETDIIAASNYDIS